MSAWRDHKRAAARALHATMGVPAVYLTTLDGAPLRVEVRVHTDIQPVDFGRAALIWISTPRKRRLSYPR